MLTGGSAEFPIEQVISVEVTSAMKPESCRISVNDVMVGPGIQNLRASFPALPSMAEFTRKKQNNEYLVALE